MYFNLVLELCFAYMYVRFTGSFRVPERTAKVRFSGTGIMHSRGWRTS